MIDMNSKRKKLIIIIPLSLIIAVAIIIPVTLILINESSNTTELGQISTGGEARDVEIKGDIAYVVDTGGESSPGGLVIINVSNPNHPSIIGSYYQSGLPFKVDVAGNIAVLANIYVGVEILNLSDLANPVKIDQYTGSGEAYDVQIIGEIAYIADWSRGLVLLNISDPSIVSEISRFSISGACTQLHVVNNIAYITDHHSSYTAIRLIDVSNPHSMSQVGYYSLNNVDFWNPYVYDNVIYVANHGSSGGEFYFLDASNYSQITSIRQFNDEGMINAAFINKSIGYFAGYENGLIIVDLMDLSNPRVIGRHFDGGHSIDVVAVGDIAYVADREDGLEIVKILNV
jgi:hypothetical protein